MGAGGSTGCPRGSPRPSRPSRPRGASGVCSGAGGGGRVRAYRAQYRVGRDRGHLDPRPRPRRLHDHSVAQVHRHMGGLGEVDHQVAGAQVGKGDAGENGPLFLAGARDGAARRVPGPRREPRAVVRVRALGSPLVRLADLLHGVAQGLAPSREGRRVLLSAPDATSSSWAFATPDLSSSATWESCSSVREASSSSTSLSRFRTRSRSFFCCSARVSRWSRAVRARRVSSSVRCSSPASRSIVPARSCETCRMTWPWSSACCGSRASSSRTYEEISLVSWYCCRASRPAAPRLPWSARRAVASRPLSFATSARWRLSLSSVALYVSVAFSASRYSR